jgi:hypothetical protein
VPREGFGPGNGAYDLDQVGVVLAVKSSPTKPKPGTAPVIAAASCRLPVAVRIAGIPSVPAQFTAGFITLPGDIFTADPRADVTAMPHDPDSYPHAPRFYSPTLQRWVPAVPPEATIDGRKYVYQLSVPGTSDTPTKELHLYDIATGVDRTIWSYRGLIQPLVWDGNRLIVQADEYSGNSFHRLAIDTIGGGVVRISPATDPTRRPPPNAGSMWTWWILAADVHGDRLYVESLKADIHNYQMVLVSSNGQSTNLFSGSFNSPTGVIPVVQYFDSADSIWFPGSDGVSAWNWSRFVGLRKHTISGLPPFSPKYPQSGQLFNAHRVIFPVGSCVSS